MRNSWKILIALSFFALTSVEAQAQFFGRPGYGGMPMGGGMPFGGRGFGGGNPYANVQRWGQQMGFQQRQFGIATDCTDYGLGDCAERMARMGHPNGPGSAFIGGGGGWNGGGMGWGRGPGFAPGYGGGRVVTWGYQHSYGGGYGQPQHRLNPVQRNFAACSPFLHKDNFMVNNDLVFESVWGGNGTLCLRPDPMRNQSVFVIFSREDYAILLAQAREAIGNGINERQVNWIKKRIHDEAVAQRLVRPQQQASPEPVMDGEFE
ncbi:hypothetical protein FJY93_04670 [Candidatus Kaiserbacteria bacterium]|nr:hypothetical protein [Candidatus Kaiserbacteria bacterium]